MMPCSTLTGHESAMTDQTNSGIERELRNLAYLPRWSIVCTGRTQSVAEHSAFTAIYADRICDVLEHAGHQILSQHRHLILRLALTHDLDELYSSDIPGPTKLAMSDGWHKELSNWLMVKTSEVFWWWRDEMAYPCLCQCVVKVADMLERSLFLREEQSMGNSNLEELLSASDILLGNAVNDLRVRFNEAAVDEVERFIRHSLENGVKPPKILK